MRNKLQGCYILECEVPYQDDNQANNGVVLLILWH